MFKSTMSRNLDNFNSTKLAIVVLIQREEKREETSIPWEYYINSNMVSVLSFGFRGNHSTNACFDICHLHDLGPTYPKYVIPRCKWFLIDL